MLLQLGGRCGPDIRHCLRTAALLLLLKCNTHVAVQWNLATLKHHSALPCQVQPGNILSAFVAPGAMICFPWAMIGCAWQPLDEMQGIQQEQSNATTAIFCISKIFLLRDFVGFSTCLQFLGLSFSMVGIQEDDSETKTWTKLTFCCETIFLTFCCQTTLPPDEKLFKKVPF